MTIQKFRALFLLLIISLIKLSAIAQDSLVKDLKEVTITATRTERKLPETGRTIHVITEEDILKSNYTSLGEILSEQAGLYITGTGQNPGSNQSLFMRGANSNQTAIYIDGLRITDASTVNNTIDLSELSIHDIERIEIIKGSHSTLYGSSAIGGVINIKTRQNHKEGLNVRAGITGGDAGNKSTFLNPYMNTGYQFKNGIGINSFVDHTQVKGFDSTIDTLNDPLLSSRRDKDDWKKLYGGLSATYKDKETDLQLSWKYTSSETDIDKSAFTDDDNYTLNFNRNAVTLLMKRQLSGNSMISLTGGHSWYSREAVNDSSLNPHSNLYDHQFTKDKYSGKTTNLDLFYERKFSFWKIIAGLAATKDIMESENYIYSAFYADPFPPFIFENKSELKSPSPSMMTSSIYGQLEFSGSLLHQGLRDLVLVSGVRYDMNDIFNEHFSLQINPSYKLSRNSLLYFSYSTGFNSPSLYQLYSPNFYTPWDGSQGAPFSQGNRSLRPETSACTELGLKIRMKEKVHAGISVFHRLTKNNIEYAYLWNGAVPAGQLGTDFTRDDYRGDTYINTGTTDMYGLEIQMTISPVRNVTLQTSLSLMDGKIKYQADEILTGRFSSYHVQLYNNGRFLTTTPMNQESIIRRPNMARLQLTYTGFKRFTPDVSVNYVDDREDVFYDTQIMPQGALNTIRVEKYALVNLSLSYNAGKNILMSACSNNILDEKYSEVRGFTTRGRSILFRIVWHH